MKNTYLLIVALMATMCTFSQTVKGIVYNSSNQKPIQGAEIKEKNGLKRTLSDADGFFTLELSQENNPIIVSYVGLGSQEIETKDKQEIKVYLDAASQNIDEVVVTALSVERSNKDLGYVVQTLKEKDISDVKSVNFLDDLAGKIAGVNISQGATGVGSSTQINIRGENSFTNNNPLFVVDGIIVNNNSVINPNNDDAAGFMAIDFGNSAMDINADDIAEVSVLKGPAAAALYGTRASNGVIIITTKKGTAKKGLGISYNSSNFVESAFKLPEFQNKYGQGNGGKFEYKDGLGGGTNDVISYSWGPALDQGTKIAQFDSPVTLSNGQVVRGGDIALYDNKTNKITPTEFVSHEDNLKKFYNTGLTSMQNIAITNATEKSDMRISLTDLRSKSIIPGVNLDRTTVAGNFNFYPTTRLKISSSLNYMNTSSKNRPAAGYGSENLNYGLVAWGPRNMDIEGSLQDYWQPGLEGLQQFSYNYTYFDNPYFTVYENRNSFNRNRLIGNLVASYKITNDLNLQVRSGMDYSDDRRQLRRAYSSNRFKLGAYGENDVFFQENNTDVLLTYVKKIKTIGLEFLAGANRMDQQVANRLTIANGLAQPGIYSLTNNANPLEINEYFGNKRINSVYGVAKLNINSFFFMDISGRNDWSSALATPTSTENVSFFYPSVSSAFLLNKVVKLPEIISLAKVRASYAKVGNDTDPFQTTNTFLPQVSFAGQPTYSAQSTIANINLMPEKTSAFETGIDIRLFKNRVGLDVTYYNTLTENQIIALPVPSSSGYNQQVVNGGAVRSKGIEAILNIKPIQKENFTWVSSFNFSKNVSTVEQLPEGVSKITLAYNRVYDNVNQTVWFQVEEGGRIGDMYGTGYKKTADGQFILTADGNYIPDNNLKKLGNYNPNFMLGWNNNFSYKNFSANFLFDWRQGGIIVSRTLALAAVGGQLIETEIRPDGGIVADGVVNAGTEANPEYVKNEKAISAESYYRQYYDRNHEENNVYNASYLKLRQFSISYTFKEGKNENGLIGNGRSLQVSLIGRNLFAISKIPHFDPEQLATQGQKFVRGVEDMSYATTRSFGLKLNYNF